MSLLKRINRLNLLPWNEDLYWSIQLKEILNEDINEATKILDTTTINLLGQQIHPEDQFRGLITHAILRICLQQTLNVELQNIQIYRNSYGKPYLPKYPLHFNLSHTRELAFIGIHPHYPIGVDIEGFQSLIEGDFWVTDLERKWMTSIPMDSQQFLLCLWCAKEALLKAKGTGFLTNRLPEFERVKCCDESTYLFESNNLDEVFVYSKKIDMNVLAVCLNKEKK